MICEEVTEPIQKFPTGEISITNKALRCCLKFGVDYHGLAIRHASGDFGNVGHLDNVNLTRAERQHGSYMTDDGLKLNAIAILIRNGMVLSIYPLEKIVGVRIWVKTDFSTSVSRTIIMLSNEYESGGHRGK